MLRIYGIKNCDTMKKAFAWLETNGVAYEFVDYKKAGVAASQLADWNRRAGWKTLLNTRGLIWKKLSETQRADLDETKALALMTEYPSLIKRPVADFSTPHPAAVPDEVAVHDSVLLIGFDAERYQAVFLGGQK